MYAMMIYAPGIDCKVSDPKLAKRVVCGILDRIYYDDERCKDIITLHDIENDTVKDLFAEIKIDDSGLVCVNKDIFSPPDSVAKIGAMICEHFGGE